MKKIPKGCRSASLLTSQEDRLLEPGISSGVRHLYCFGTFALLRGQPRQPSLIPIADSLPANCLVETGERAIPVERLPDLHIIKYMVSHRLDNFINAVGDGHTRHEVKLSSDFFETHAVVARIVAAFAVADPPI